MRAHKTQRRAGYLRSQIGTRRRLHGGSVLLWFMVISLPLSFFVTSETWDLAQAYLMHREVTNAAFAAAEAGAFQITYNTTTLNTANAQSVATDTWNYEVATGGVPHGAIIVGPPQVTATSRVVTITVDFQVGGPKFGILFGQTSNQVYSVTATAFVCVPTAAPGFNSGQAPTQGFCATPTAA